MRVIQVPRRFVRSDWGGTETVILETSKALLALGHHTEIYCPRALSTEDHEVIDGIPVTRFGYLYPYLGLSEAARVQMDRKGGNLFSFPLMRGLRRFPHLDLIHLHTGKRLGAIGRYVAAQRKIPYVISLHGGVYDVPAGEAQTWTAPANGTFEWGKVLGWWVGARRVLDDAAAIVCVGRKELKEAPTPPSESDRGPPAQRGGCARASPAAMAADSAARRGIPADAFVILVVGRIDPQKNQLLAVRLLAELRRVEPRAHLVLVGPVTNADYDASLSKEISALGLDANVTLIRGLETSDPDLVNAYHAADLFLLPSVHEPFGIVILEAWAAGLPVVASNVGGVPSFVSDGENGCLFPSGDLAALLGTVREMIANPDRRRKIAEAGKEEGGRRVWVGSHYPAAGGHLRGGHSCEFSS